jgi:hypothetical protein
MRIAVMPHKTYIANLAQNGGSNVASKTPPNIEITTSMISFTKGFRHDQNPRRSWALYLLIIHLSTYATKFWPLQSKLYTERFLVTGFDFLYQAL